MDSDLDFDKAKHIYFHLASAANKLEAKHEIEKAISVSSKVEVKKPAKQKPKPEKPTKRELLIKELSKKVKVIERKIAGMEDSGGYDSKRLFNLKMKVEIIKNRIKKLN